MTWTPLHGTLLCREILTEEPKFKHGSQERGHQYDKFAINLNTIGKPRFQEDQISARDRFLKLERNFKRKVAHEEHASRTNPPEPTELHVAVQDIVDRTAEAQEDLVK